VTDDDRLERREAGPGPAEPTSPRRLILTMHDACQDQGIHFGRSSDPPLRRWCGVERRDADVRPANSVEIEQDRLAVLQKIRLR
jgi:hypothetical protein